MMNLLTLVLVTLPGLTLSFTNNAPSNDPLKDLNEELQLRVAPPSPARGPDDSDALLREALRMASRRLSEANGPRGYYQSAEAPLRDSLLSEILRLDRRGGGSGLTTYDGSAMADKRGRGAYVDAGKRGRVPGGPNELWTWPPPQQQNVFQVVLNELNRILSELETILPSQTAE